MRTRFLVFGMLLAMLMLPGTLWAGGSAETIEETSPSGTMNSAKYVFFFIGDGMGMPQINAAEHYLAAKQGKVSGQEYLSFSRFPAQAFTTTYANDRWW
jgi:alkaline phosphatase